MSCRTCMRFIPATKRRHDEDGPGHCKGYDRPAHSTDARCVLFNEIGVWQTRQMQQPAKPRPTNR